MARYRYEPPCGQRDLAKPLIRVTDQGEGHLLVDSKGKTYKKDPTAACELGSTAMAETYTKPPGSPYLNTITVCPWFIQYMQDSKAKSCSSFRDYVKGLIAKVTDKGVSRVNGFVEIDLWSLPDKVMLHEVH